MSESLKRLKAFVFYPTVSLSEALEPAVSQAAGGCTAGARGSPGCRVPVAVRTATGSRCALRVAVGVPMGRLLTILDRLLNKAYCVLDSVHCTLCCTVLHTHDTP